jgi:radical SAM protein with 4Fe4S-binding SPASM domain
MSKDLFANHLTQKLVPFRTYSCLDSSGQQIGHVLLHAGEPRWILVNPTAFEIIKNLEKGLSVQQIVARLINIYGLSESLALQDVSSVIKQLSEQGFLCTSKTQAQGSSNGLQRLYFHLTNWCNLSCRHCYLIFPSKGSRELSHSKVEQLIRTLAEGGGRAVVFSGGEPMLHSRLKDILIHTNPDLKITLLTNGTLIDREWAAFFSGLNITIQLSLDGSREEIHDSIRGKGSFVKTLKAIEYLQERGLGPRLSLSTTVMNQNRNDLRGLISLAEKLAVPMIRFAPLRREGSAESNWESTGSELGIHSYEDFFQYVTDFQERLSPKVNVNCGLSGFLFKNPNYTNSGGESWCPLGEQLVVNVNGDAFPCAFLLKDEFKLGNVFQDSLSELLHSDRMNGVCKALQDRRSKIEKCANCTWINLCQTGCMGQAMDHKGTLWDTDHFCEFRQKAYKQTFDKLIKREFSSIAPF